VDEGCAAALIVGCGLRSTRECGRIILQQAVGCARRSSSRGCEMRSKASFRYISLLAILMLAMATIVVTVPRAQGDEVSHARIVRLSFVEGDVAFQRSGAEPGSEWQRAGVNLPIQQGFSVRTDAGYAEVEFETGLAVHLAGNTQLEFTELNMVDGHRVTALKLDRGTIITTASLQHGDELSIVSGNMNVTAPRNGRFRIDAVQSQDWVTVFHGKVDVATGTTTTGVESGKTLHFGGTESLLSVDRSPEPDAFDKWAAQRDQADVNAQTRAGEFLNQREYSYSTGDLYNYGLWANVAGYGMGWQPYGIGANWMPFSNGMWMDGGFFGAPFGDAFGGSAMGDLEADMWLSAEPWGWLPYHYGAWTNIQGAGWFWFPQNLRTFRGATANFVNVGNQLGWMPTPAVPINPRKFKPGTAGPTEVVFAGTASNGIILAGPHGILPAGTTVKTVPSHGAKFVQQAAPTVVTLAASGVRVTGRAPMTPTTTGLRYTAHVNAGKNNVAPANLSAPTGRAPMAPAPRAAPVAVMRAPSTFANPSFAGGRTSGVTAVTSSASGGGYHGTSSGQSGVSSASNSGGGHSGGTGASGGTAPAGGGAAGGASGGTASGKH
jgi:hypothetical protein